MLKIYLELLLAGIIIMITAIVVVSVLSIVPSPPIIITNIYINSELPSTDMLLHGGSTISLSVTGYNLVGQQIALSYMNGSTGKMNPISTTSNQQTISWTVSGTIFSNQVFFVATCKTSTFVTSEPIRIAPSLFFSFPQTFISQETLTAAYICTFSSAQFTTNISTNDIDFEPIDNTNDTNLHYLYITMPIVTISKLVYFQVQTNNLISLGFPSELKFPPTGSQAIFCSPGIFTHLIAYSDSSFQYPLQQYSNILSNQPIYLQFGVNTNTPDIFSSSNITFQYQISSQNSIGIVNQWQPITDFVLINDTTHQYQCKLTCTGIGLQYANLQVSQHANNFIQTSTYFNISNYLAIQYWDMSGTDSVSVTIVADYFYQLNAWNQNWCANITTLINNTRYNFTIPVYLITVHGANVQLEIDSATTYPKLVPFDNSQTFGSDAYNQAVMTQSSTMSSVIFNVGTIISLQFFTTFQNILLQTLPITFEITKNIKNIV